ncbi:MAG: hypothetical protein ACI4JA_01770 [Oscillospiraceae bacterium]
MIKEIPIEKLVVRPSMKLDFMGGEIWFEQLDALSVHTELAMKKFTDDLKQIRRISSPSRIAVNVNETLVTDEFADLLVDELCLSDKYITKLVFVGTDTSVKRKLHKRFRKKNYSFAVGFINDYEKAKIWLMTESC